MVKRTIALAAALILVLLAGCTLLETLPSSGSPVSTEGPAKETTASVSPSAETVTTTAETAAPETTAAPDTEATTEVTTEAPTETPTEASTEAPAGPVDPWSLMGELLFEQGSYTDQFGYTDSYSFGLPCLNADTPDAIAINEDIDFVFGAGIRDAKKAMQEGNSLSLHSTGYYGEVWEDVLSLVIIAGWEWSFDDYGVFCYDVTAGRRLDTPALLEKMGYSQERFLEACKLKFHAYFEEMYQSIAQDERESYGYYEALERAVSPEFVNLGLMAYPDANGDIVVIAPIVSLAGADFYYHPIHLGLNQAN